MTVLARDAHDQLVSRFYASAMGEAPWTDTLSFGAGLFGAGAAVFRLAAPDGQVLAAQSTRYDNDFAVAYYGSEIYANDPRRPHLEGVTPGTIYYDHLLYDVEAMAADRWCREACGILEVKYQLGASLGLPNGATGALAFLSSEVEGHASEAAIEAFARVAPHIEQAAALGHVIEAGAATRAALLDALALRADGVLLLGRAGAPTYMNDAARAILGAGDGLAHAMGTFVTARPPETRRLHQLVHSALTDPDRPGGRLLVSRSSGRRPYVVSVTAAPPMERFLTRQSIACVIHIQDLAAVSLPSPGALAAVFGLTEREADLAVELVRCAGLIEAAGAAGMALNTARNHLQAIFRKTGTASQAEAVQLLGRLP